MMFKLLIPLFLLSSACTFGQDMAIYQWRDHFPLQDANDVVVAGDIVYCASDNALFSYDLVSDELRRISKVNDLSDVGVSAINYSDAHKTLIVGFSNGNLDLVTETGNQNLPFIKINASLIGDKTINSIRVDDDNAYLSCGFGIVVVDLVKREIKETYIIGPNNTLLSIAATAVQGDSIYAATNQGLYVAFAASPFLLDFNSWTRRTDFPVTAIGDTLSDVFEFNNKLHVMHYNNSVQTLYVYDSNIWQTIPSLAGKVIRDVHINGNNLYVCHDIDVEVYDVAYTSIFTYSEPFDFKPQGCVFSDGKLYTASFNRGLVIHEGATQWLSRFPKGPQGSTAFEMDYDDGMLWTVAGAASGTAWNNTNTAPGVSVYNAFEWERYGYFNTNGFIQDTVFDVLSVAIDPDDNNHVFLGVHSKKGLVEFKDGQYVQAFDDLNSTLQDRYVGRMGVPAVKYDDDGNLWMTNLLCSKPLSVLTAEGDWYAFDISLVDNKAATKMVIDDAGRKWVVQSGTGISVVENQEPISDGLFQTKVLSTIAGSGGLPSTEIKSIAIDLDGEIWVGTDAGPAVFYSPDNVFDGGSIDAQQILLEQDGNLQLLLETEIISDIEIDGGNRKWLATENSGAFLMSEDGTEEILHFTSDNSPLFSDNVISIEINDNTGEVFFGTDKGLISFKGDATKGDSGFSDVLAYPNPVPEGYSGSIVVKGLARDSDVKITDLSGRVVFFTTSFGGQAVWDGSNFEGQKAVAGVYLVFATDATGNFSEVTKIFLVN